MPYKSLDRRYANPNRLEVQRAYQRKWEAAKRARLAASQTRVCERCKQAQPLAAFGVMASGRLRAKCRPCEAERKKELQSIQRSRGQESLAARRAGPPLPDAFDTGYPYWVAGAVPVHLHERVVARRVNWIVPVEMAEEVEA